MWLNHLAPLLAAQTVPASQVTQMAKPLQKHEDVQKGKIWLLFIGGAAGLFITTVLLENNKGLFPAIARANEALAKTRAMNTEQELQVRCVLKYGLYASVMWTVHQEPDELSASGQF